MRQINTRSKDIKLTSRDSIALKKYLTEVSNTKVISADEEVKLFNQYKNGSELARLKIIKSNLRFVLSCAKFYINRGVSYEDLVSEGNYGLSKAVERFDISKGFKFISYAVWWIQQSMLYSIYNNSKNVRVPQPAYMRLIKIDEAKSKFRQEFEREPSIEELTEIVDIPEKIIKRTLKASVRSVYLEQPHPEAEITLLETIPADEIIKNTEHEDNLKVTTNKLINYSLTEEEKVIIESLYGINCVASDVADVAKKLDIKESLVRARRDKAIKKMRYQLICNKNFKNSLI